MSVARKPEVPKGWQLAGGRRLSAMQLTLMCLLVVALSGCIYNRSEQRLENALGKLQARLSATHEDRPRLLVYRVDGHAGRWIYEIVLGQGRYAERRTRADGRHFAFGFDERGAWLTVDGAAAIAANATPWEDLARTRSALFSLAFAAPGADDEVEFMGRDRRRWELAFRPAGGNTMNFSIDRRHHLPREMDWVDSWTRMVTCDGLTWDESPDGAVLSRDRCGAGSLSGTIATASSRLVAMEGMQAAPAWTFPLARRSPPPLTEPVRVPIVDSRRLTLPVRINGRATGSLVLDTGAFHTILSEDLAVRAHVMPTGEPSLFVDPPFLDRSELWIGVVDTLEVGGAVLHGERVLVARNPRMLGPDQGLLGESFFRAFTVDVDSPRRTVSVWDHRAFTPSPDQQRVRTHGRGAIVEGAVRDVAAGTILLDTGMPNSIVVSAPMMSIKHRRQRGSSAQLSARDNPGGGSTDYYATIRGLRLGPVDFPSMEAIGRDRDREKLGIGVAPPPAPPPASNTIDLGPVQVELLSPPSTPSATPPTPHMGAGIAVVGMGVMRYLRITFDHRKGFLLVSTGDAYRVLIKLGADIERGLDGPAISRVLEHGPAAAAGLQEGDRVVGVNGQRVTDTDDALHRVASQRGPYCHLEVERHGMRRHIMVDVAHPLIDNRRW